MKKKIKNISFGLSLKKDKQMRLFFDDQKMNQKSLENRQKFFKKIKKDFVQSVSCQLAHGKKVLAINNNHAGKVMPSCDGLITHEKNLILTVTAADCLPIYFYCKNKNAIGLVHAGWRGIKKNIVKSAVDGLVKNFGCSKNQINVYIGPHVKKCHFLVQKDLVKKFNEYQKFIYKNKSGQSIDLSGIVKFQLVSLGLDPKKIKIDSACTYCDKKYFSNRRDKPKEIEAMIGYIFLE